MTVSVRIATFLIVGMGLGATATVLGCKEEVATAKKGQPSSKGPSRVRGARAVARVQPDAPVPRSRRDNLLKLTQSEFGAQWPYVADEAFIVCKDRRDAGVIQINGKEYALNGVAAGAYRLPFERTLRRVTHNLGKDEAGKEVRIWASSDAILQLALEVCR